MGKDAKDVKIAKAKGRPMLTWVGKKPLSHVKAYPAQHIETFAVEAPQDALAAADWAGWPEKFPQGGLLFHGDNKDVLAYLLANGFRGKVKLIYIDPPFDSGADYIRYVQIRGTKQQKLEGESYSLGEQVQYRDIWANDSYLQFMYERLLMLRELLHFEGSIFLHCDPARNAYLRVLMDEVFGADNFLNEIVWQRQSAHSSSGTYGAVHDTLLYYAKSNTRIWNPERIELSESYIEQFFDQIEEETGRRYARGDLTGAGISKGKTGETWRGINPGAAGRHWTIPPEELDSLDREGRIHWPKKGMPRLKRYLDEVKAKGGVPQDVWTDIKPIHNQSTELLDYPTQKPEALITRVINGTTNKDDIVLDCFIGSGTTASVSQMLGRKWIGCDINKGAIQTTAKRLQTVMQEQAKAASAPAQKDLADDESETPKPCQFSFTTWRVNDYDLHIQHNEAVELVAEYIGITRTRADNYFDGTLGPKLVKIVPFNHPLTPLDIEDLKGELKRRPEEERDIVLVSLGMELAAKKVIEDHNRNRPINKLEVIELRTNKRYGGIIRHEPLSASVEIKRDGGKLLVEIHDVFSPAILQRLDMQEGVFRAKIEDWRAVVDCVMIDTDYNGDVFNVALSDIPARKQDLVEGRYQLVAPKKGATVAVKIIDMLGEEALVTAQL